MKLTWNAADKVIAELPKGAGQLDLHHTRPKIEGREHSRPVFDLTTESLILHVPETTETDLQGLMGATAEDSTLILTFEDGTEKHLHAGSHASQIASLISGLLEPEDALLDTLSRQAESGDVKAMEHIALIYEHRQDREKARIWNERAEKHANRRHRPAHKAEEAAIRQAGLDYQEEKAGDVIDRLSANDLWLASRGFAEVNDRASEWKYLQRAAELSHPDAHYQMGAYLATGMHETEADEKEAFRHMKEAAELGSKEAPYYLGSWYRNGVGTEKDLEQADHWLAKDPSVKAMIQRVLVQEELGHRDQAEALAKEAMARTTSDRTRALLQKKIDNWDTPSPEPEYLKAADSYNRQKTDSQPKAVSARDLMEAARGYEEVSDYVGERKALEEAARLMHPEANYKLGAYLASGMHENEKDEKAAFQWMMHAADLGNDKAPYYLGMWYANGTGIERDLDQAAFWLAKDSSPKAKIQLALVKKAQEDTKTARSLMQEARDATTVQVTKNLAQRKLDQWQAEQDDQRKQTQKDLRIAHALNDAGQYDLAAEFLEQAARGGSNEAKYLLALLLLKGQGVTADPERAKELLLETRDTQPESLYYLTYLETDPDRQKEYARAYLAGNPEKTRKAQVEQLLAGPGAKNPPAEKPETDPVQDDASTRQEAARLRQSGITKIQKGDPAGTDDLQKAADLGDTDACVLLGEAMLETDPAQGVVYLKKAARAGIGDAYALLAYAYMNGLGVPRNDRRAHLLVHKALRRGSRIARKWTLGY